MSEGVIACTSAQRRPPWLAWLAGWLTTVSLGWLLLLVYIERDNARLDEGHAFEGDGAVRPPALFTLDWLQNAALSYSKVLLVGLAYAIPMFVLIALLERRAERSRMAWCLAGALAAAPLAGAWLLIAALSPHIIPWSVYLVPALVIAALGIAGGSAAHLVRHGWS